MCIHHDVDELELELERVLARSWLYVGHEIQLAEPGDCFTTTMDEDAVIVTRDRTHAGGQRLGGGAAVAHDLRLAARTVTLTANVLPGKNPQPLLLTAWRPAGGRAARGVRHPSQTRRFAR